MRNIKLLLAYDGTQYAGWQRQKKDSTIQGVLEEKLSTMTGEAVTLHGAGRTDAGVHALGMAAHFHTASAIPCTGFLRWLNSLLPDDIQVLEAVEVELAFHARRSAQSKTYLYYLNVGDVALPTDRLYSVHVHGGLDDDAIRACLPVLVGRHDFSSFEAAGSRDMTVNKGKGAVRRIFTAGFDQVHDQPCKYCFEIAGDGFLRHMVRNIVGTLIEVGKGKRSVGDFKAVLAAKDRSQAGPTAPARGLFLKQVVY